MPVIAMIAIPTRWRRSRSRRFGNARAGHGSYPGVARFESVLDFLCVRHLLEVPAR